MNNNEVASLEHKITYYKKIRTQTESGAYNTDFEKIGEVFASIRYKTGRELLKAAIVAENSIVVRVYNDSISRQITANDIIQYKYYNETITLEIISKNYEMAAKNFIDFECKKGLAYLENGNC